MQAKPQARKEGIVRAFRICTPVLIALGLTPGLADRSWAEQGDPDTFTTVMPAPGLCRVDDPRMFRPAF